MRSDAGPWSCLFFIAWIFIGNFVLLQAFLAILLDKFSLDDGDEIAEIEDAVEDELIAEGNYNGMLTRKTNVFAERK